MVKSTLNKLFFLVFAASSLVACSQKDTPTYNQNSSTSSDSGLVSESSQTSTSSTATSSSEEPQAPVLEMTDYYPLTINYDANFKGVGNEFAGFHRRYDYIEDNYIQMRTNNGGTTVMSVVKIDDTGVYEVFSRPETYIRENYISRVKDFPVEKTILKAPLKVGTKWDVLDGTAEITAVDKELKLESGTYTTIEVTNDLSGLVSKQYYAKGVGLVYQEDNLKEDKYRVTASLDTLNTDGWTEQITLFQVNDNATGLVREEVTLDIKTNDVMRQKFEAILNGSTGKQALLPEGTKIQALYTKWNHDKDNMELTVDFSKEIENVKGSTAVQTTYPAIFQTLSSYYMGTKEVVPTVNNKPITIDQVGTYKPGQAFPLEEVDQ